MPPCAPPEPCRLDQAEAIIAIQKKWQRCWTRWRRCPAAAAHRDGRRRGLDPGQRLDGGGLTTALCAALEVREPLCTGTHGADRPASRGQTATAWRVFSAGKRALSDVCQFSDTTLFRPDPGPRLWPKSMPPCLTKASICVGYARCTLILAGQGEVVDRRRLRRHPVYQKPELLAEAPNLVWSWK